VAQRGLHVTEVRDRKYFRSIYFREPGGILFEIATDGPGMTIDEDVRRLGLGLCLPDALEHRRPEIERRLPEVAVPD
jgi:glyoxalase family protein